MLNDDKGPGKSSEDFHWAEQTAGGVLYFGIVYRRVGYGHKFAISLET